MRGGWRRIGMMALGNLALLGGGRGRCAPPPPGPRSRARKAVAAHHGFPIGSSLPMIGDWDTGRQPAVALREPMA
jgi:hypothetical protein